MPCSALVWKRQRAFSNMMWTVLLRFWQLSTPMVQKWVKLFLLKKQTFFFFFWCVFRTEKLSVWFFFNMLDMLWWCFKIFLCQHFLLSYFFWKADVLKLSGSGSALFSPAQSVTSGLWNFPAVAAFISLLFCPTHLHVNSQVSKEAWVMMHPSLLHLSPQALRSCASSWDWVSWRLLLGKGQQIPVLPGEHRPLRPE